MLKFKKNIFFKNVSVLLLGTIISQGINVLGLPILSRMYSVAEFASLALFMAIGLIVLSFSTLQLDLAIVKTKELKERLALIRLAFSAVLMIAILVCVGLMIWMYWNPALSFTFIFLLLLFFLFNAGNQILIYFFNSEKQYQKIATARILIATINLVFAIILFFINPKAGLILSLTIANAISFTYLVIFFRKKLKTLFSISQKEARLVFNQNSNFVKFSTPASFLDILAYQVVILFLSEFFTEEITGSYFMAMRVVLLPTGLIGYAISQVFYKEISDKFSNQKLTSNEFWSIWKFLFALGIIPFALLFFFGEILFGFVLGADWEFAGQMASILSLSGFFIFLSSPTSTGFVVMNQQKYNLINSSIRTIYTIIFLLIAAWKKDIFFFLWSYAVAELVMIILYNWIMLQLIPEASHQ